MLISTANGQFSSALTDLFLGLKRIYIYQTYNSIVNIVNNLYALIDNSDTYFAFYTCWSIFKLRRFYLSQSKLIDHRCWLKLKKYVLGSSRTNGCE